MKYPTVLNQLMEHFRKIPGVGQKTAERYALHILTHFDPDTTQDFADTLHKLNASIQPCPTCGFLTDQDVCEICRDTTRDEAQLIVVEEVKDVIVFENTHTFNGRYHVLNGALSPSEGIAPEDLNIESLKTRVHAGAIQEMIVATNFSEAGETTALYLQHIFKDHPVELTRIGYGLPAGGNISYADEITLNKAIEGRRKMIKS